MEIAYNKIYVGSYTNLLYIAGSSIVRIANVRTTRRFCLQWFSSGARVSREQLQTGHIVSEVSSGMCGASCYLLVLYFETFNQHVALCRVTLEMIK